MLRFTEYIAAETADGIRQLFDDNRFSFCNCSEMPFHQDLFPEITFLEAAKHLSSLEEFPLKRAVGFCALAYADSGASRESRQALCQRALTYNPQLAKALWVLAMTLFANFTHAQLPDGRSLTRRELCAEALIIESNPNFYCSLSRTLTQTDTVSLPDGRVFNKLSLIMAALKCDPKSGTAYCHLGLYVREGGLPHIRLDDGRCLSERDLYQEAIKLDPMSSFAYGELARIVGKNELVILLDGRVLTGYQIMMEAAMFDSVFANYPGSYRRSHLMPFVPATEPWSRHCSSLFLGTNVLFATLLLGLQRLESAGLPPTPHFMLEDILQGWTWGDSVGYVY